MVLIIQTGNPVAIARNEFGDFSDWFIAGMNVSKKQTRVVDVHRNQRLDQVDLSSLTAVVVTGSASMVTERADWMLYTQKWLHQVFLEKIPTLGVCFGHQLIADMLGGRVDYNPKGRNMGESQFVLNAEGKEDALFSGVESKINTYVSHQQCVVKLPESVKLLGSCELDQNHAYRYQDHIWGLQFHPEWNQAIMAAYINQRQQDLEKEGFRPQQMRAALTSCNQSFSLLNQFAQLANVFK